MIEPTRSAGFPAWTTAAGSGSPSELTPWPGESFTVDPEAAADLKHRIMLAQINHELSRGCAPMREVPPAVTPEPAGSTADNGWVERGHSTTGMLQDAHTNMGVGEMGGPTSPGELFGDSTAFSGYLVSRPNLWPR